MSEMTVSVARERLAQVVDDARISREPVYLSRHGRRVAAVVDADQLAQLVADAEDLADLRAAAQARAEMAQPGGESIPWEAVKADLGLT